MLQKQIMRSFRISWRSFDVKSNKPLINILEPSKNIYNSWLNQTFCTIGQNQTLDKSVSVNTTQLKDEQKTDEILEKIFVEGSRELSKGRKKGDSDFIDWNNTMQLIKRSEEVLPDIKPTPEELANIRATKPVASLASLVNESPTLQKLIDLGVGLWSWEKQGQLGLAVKLDFQQDVVPLIQFLTDLGVPSDHLGLTLTRSAELLEQSIQDLTTRVDYLKSKKLTSEDILNIVAKTPKWLTFSVKGIDGRLGFLQKTFQLSGDEVRMLAVDSPDLVVNKNLVKCVQNINFSLTEEMGFSASEIKSMLLCDARIFLVGRERLTITFDILHNEAGIPHKLLSKFPEALYRHGFRIRHRHQFLLKLQRAQYDPSLPNYVSPAMLADHTPEEFCEQVAKCDTELYFKFLRTL